MVDASFNESGIVDVKGFIDCPNSCCYSAENIIYKSKELFMLTNQTMYGYLYNKCVPILTYQDFISYRVGSITQEDDIYILTKQYLYIKYPKLTNE